MLKPKARVTERSFYPDIIKKINSVGGEGVSEVSFNSDPDVIFKLSGYEWILSVKIGTTISILKSAFLQYLRHKEESKIPFGILLILPESVRGISANEESIQAALAEIKPTVLIDAGEIKEELRDRPFLDILSFIQTQVIDRLERKITSYYKLKLVIELLQEQVSEMMREISIDEETIMHIVTNRDLLMDIGHLNRKQSEDVGRFLASYILLSQILFLRLFYAEQAKLFINPIKPNRHSISKAFAKIKEINYRPIYSVNVLDVIPDQFLEDTFRLIWGLELERVRHELPGRIFHELMPSSIRKMLAAFYTRPLAADLLSKLAINNQNDSVFDPACGSGTILVSAYKRKLEIFENNCISGNPHKRFCEEEIFGADIMPFSVHLTSANLAAMDVATTIDRTQIIQGDSIKLASGTVYEGGVAQLDTFQSLYNTGPKASNTSGDTYNVELGDMDVIIMNPPFTKVERGIRHYVDMDRFNYRCGGEVGLWGHFIVLANEFLSKDGIFAAVIPINILRGRESKLIRKIVFNEWSPLYIIKSVKNYGFSEWSEYRDILLIAQKKKSKNTDKVKFCLIKKDLTVIDETDIVDFTNQIQTRSKLRSESIDIDTHNISELKARTANLMWFCGGIDFNYRDSIIDFYNMFNKKLIKFKEGYCITGFRPNSGISKFLFLTRSIDNSRIEKAFLRFNKEFDQHIEVESPLGAKYIIDKDVCVPSIRTPVGIQQMDITHKCDYVVQAPYKDLKRVYRAAKVESPTKTFWQRLPNKIQSLSTHLMVSRRINPFSPSTHHFAFYSETYNTPTDQMNIIKEGNPAHSRALCTIMNSIIFWSQFFQLKEESTGRYIDIRVYDLEEMYIDPPSKYVPALVKIFENFKDVSFPALCNQFDENFALRYKEYWEAQESTQERLWNIITKPISPFQARLDFDLQICKALGLKTSKKLIIKLYEIFVKEMIITRHLARD